MNGSTFKRGGIIRRALGMPGAILLAAFLTGWVPRQAASAPGQAAAQLLSSPQVGQAFDVVPAKSRLIVLVYRAGLLAGFGHDHVVACRCLTGAVYLPSDPLRASFDVHIAVKQLTVDDPALRAAEHSAKFPPDVSQSARQSTRKDMLAVTQLNAARYPDITLRSERLRPSSDGKRGDIIAEVLVQVAGESRSVTVPMHYEISGDEIVAAGEFPLRQTDLGLTPYRALGGALRVRDGLQVRLRLVAKRRG